MARQKDAKAWAAMTPAEQQKMVDDLNAAASRAANDRYFEALSAPALKERAEREAAARKRKR
jgi:hypothetical protein